MSDAWMVTRGDYSAYQVLAVFTTVELADAWCAEINVRKAHRWDDDAEVERIDLDPLLPSIVTTVVAEVKS